jgi:3-isopropylmalate/(R)-2-methylmalate dehydratase small subunit
VDADTLDAIVARAQDEPAYAVTVDLERTRVTGAGGVDAPFEIDPRARTRLLEGLDDIALILRHEDAIARFEAARGA